MPKLMTRKIILWGALAVTVVLTWQVSRQDAEVTEVAVVRPMAGRTNDKPVASRDLSNTAQGQGDFYLKPREKNSQPYFNLFAIPVQRRQQAEIDIVQPVLPVAPALPFKYMGIMVESGQFQVILEDGNEVLAVKAGDNLGANYKLVSINKVAKSIELLYLYLPMNITQTMVVRNESEL